MKYIYENAKYKVTKNVLIFTFLSMFFLTIFNFLTDGNNLLTAVLASILSLITILFIIKTKSYKLPAYIAIFFGLCINSYNLLGESNFENYIDFFWMINLTLFAYFTLGRLIGNIYLALNIFILLIITFGAKLNYFSLRPPSSVYNFYTYLDFSMNFIIGTVFFGYLINQFLKQANQAQEDAIVTNLKLKESNSKLQQQYDEKSIMLREIHHRVKNNLQVITSLLRLQLYKLEDEKSREPFEESISRVNSMALIHERMYKGDQVKDVNLTQYIYDLADSLIKNYSNFELVKVNVNSEIETLNLDIIVPLSLIFNELITNSLKHAFKNDSTGVIDINVTKNKNEIILSYKDNGEWKAPKNPNSFGLELIETFTEQLGGTYTLNHTNGTEYVFKFDVY